MIRYFILLLCVVPSLIHADTKEDIKQHMFNTEIALSELGKKIAETYERIESIRQKAIAVFQYEIVKKNFNEEQTKECGKELDKELVSFLKRFSESSPLNGFLTKELFISKEEELFEDFDVIKFCTIQIINEYRILKALLEEYGTLEQEHREIIQKVVEQSS